MEDLATLNTFIATTREAPALKRALAVKLTKEGYRPAEICRLLQVSRSFVSKWKGIYADQGVTGLRLGYKGSRGYLDAPQRAEVLAWLRAQQVWDLAALRAHLQERYGVVYRSLQSYYALFQAADISWKKVQKVQPKKDPDQIAAKRTEIATKLKGWAAEMLAGRRVCFFADECHLVWGDICGYAWGPTDQRLTVAVANEKQRQTYYGVLNGLNGQTIVRAYPKGDGKNTVQFLKLLAQQNPDQSIVIFWDGASYHRGQEVQAYLTEINAGRSEAEWKITCVRLAPYAPEENPMEEVWLHGKGTVRQNYHRCSAFQEVKTLFVHTVDQQTFDSSKLRDYRQFLQMT